jgi:hypothetical protein
LKKSSIFALFSNVVLGSDGTVQEDEGGAWQ